MKISIRGPIVSSNQHRFYQFYGMEATSPRSVADALAKGNGERAEVEINSGGGEIFAASEIYTALRNYAGGVHIRIVGLAASAASIARPTLASSLWLPVLMAVSRSSFFIT